MAGSKRIAAPVKWKPDPKMQAVKETPLRWSHAYTNQAFAGILYPSLALDLPIPGTEMSGIIKKLFVRYRHYDDSAGRYYTQTFGGDVLLDTEFLNFDGVVSLVGGIISDVAVPMEYFSDELNIRFNLDNQRIVRIGFQPTVEGWNMNGSLPPTGAAPDVIELHVTAGYVFS